MPALRPVVLLASSLASLACGNGRSGTLSVSARGQGTPSAASVDLGNGISVSRVRVVVKKLELEGAVASMSPPMTTPMTSPMGSPMLATVARASGSDDAEGGGGEVEIGPFVVDLSGDQLSGAVTPAFDTSVPDGTYRELELTVGPVAGAAAGTPLGDMGGASVIIDGARAASGSTPAADFHLASSLAARQELETRLVVDHAGKSANLTLLLDLRQWFTAADGRVLDPTVEADRVAIEANVLASLRVEHDDDHDGRDDDHD